MRSLGVRKFVLDYTVGFLFVFILLVFVVGSLPIVDARAKILISVECSSPVSEEEILQVVNPSLRDGEFCVLDDDCVDSMALNCEGESSPVGDVMGMVTRESLKYRVWDALGDSFGPHGMYDLSSLRVPFSFYFLVLFYGVILAEAGASVFALWRQRALKQTLTLPSGSRVDQLLKPAVFAVLFAIVCVCLNYLVYKSIGYPEVENSSILVELMASVSGIFVIVFIAPMAEELIFRGALLRFFVERNRLLTGTLIVSVLFSVFHGFTQPSLGWQLYVSSIYVVASVILCHLYIRQKNIWSPITFHAFFNGTSVVLYHSVVT